MLTPDEIELGKTRQCSGRSYKQIARELGKPEDVVRAALKPFVRDATGRHRQYGVPIRANQPKRNVVYGDVTCPHRRGYA